VPKVAQLDARRRAEAYEEEVLELDVAVQRVQRVHVRERRDELRDHDEDRVLSQGSVSFEHLLEVTAGNMLKHERDILRALEEGERAHDVRVLAALQHAHLVLKD
jgi:hypothetical protein